MDGAEKYKKEREENYREEWTLKTLYLPALGDWLANHFNPLEIAFEIPIIILLKMHIFTKQKP